MLEDDIRLTLSSEVMKKQGVKRKRLGVRGKVLIICSSLLIAAIFLGSYSSYTDAKSNLMKQLDSYLLVKTDYLNQKMADFFDKRNVILESEASSITKYMTEAKDKDTIQAYLVEQLASMKDNYGFVDVYVGYPDGSVLCGSKWQPDDPTWKANKRSWYIAADEAKDKIAYTDVYIDADTKKPVVTIAKAIRDKSGKTSAVMGIDMSLEQLDSLLSDEAIGSTGYPFILDEQGRFLIHPKYKFNEDVAKADTIYNISGGSLKEIGTNLLSEKGGIQKGNFLGTQKVYNAEKMEGTHFFIVASITYKEFVSGLSAMLVHNIIIAVVVIVLSILILTIFVGKIIKAIEQSIVKLGRLSSGELGLTVHDVDRKRADEIGAIMQAINQLDQSLTSIVNRVKNIAKTLLTSSEGLEQVAKETSSTTVGIEASIEDIASGAVNQAEKTEDAKRQSLKMGEDIENIKNSATMLYDNSIKMRETNEVAMATLRELNESNQRTITEIDAIYQQTTETNEFAQKIREVTSFITDISSQTSLLSLNASIEAVRAGEHGKGFAVVAEEIQKLAEQSNNSAKQIEDIIHTLLSNSDNAVNTMREVKDVVALQNQNLSKTKDSFNNVFEGIHESEGYIDQISKDIILIDDARKNINHVIGNLSEISEENVASTQETTSAIEELSAAMLNIGDEVSVLHKVADELIEAIQEFKMNEES